MFQYKEINSMMHHKNGDYEVHIITLKSYEIVVNEKTGQKDTCFFFFIYTQKCVFFKSLSQSPSNVNIRVLEPRMNFSSLIYLSSLKQFLYHCNTKCMVYLQIKERCNNPFQKCIQQIIYMGQLQYIMYSAGQYITKKSEISELSDRNNKVSFFKILKNGK